MTDQPKDKKKKKASISDLRLRKDIADFKQALINDPQFKMEQDEKNIQTSIKLTIEVKDKDSLWQGGHQEQTFEFNDKFPNSPPKVLMVTPIQHPNIDMDGNICLSILRAEWKPVQTLESIANGLLYMFLAPNPNDPLNHEAAQLMRENISEFNKTCLKTMKGGNMFGKTFKKFL